VTPAPPDSAPVRRGTVRVALDLAWRLDGAIAAADAPLVLALHGQGMDEDAFAALLSGLFDLPCRFLVPRAPWPFDVRHENRIGWSWYPYDGDQQRFAADLAHTETMLLAMLHSVEQEHGLQPQRRILLGFSQGGYCGAVIALRHPELFSGLVVSGARVKTEILDLGPAREAGMQVLLLHGLRDVAVLPEAAERGRDALRDAGIAVDLHSFDTGHTIGRRQVQVIRGWLEGRIARGDPQRRLRP
jgi:phospholipase/carboxylesterase